MNTHKALCEKNLQQYIRYFPKFMPNAKMTLDQWRVGQIVLFTEGCSVYHDYAIVLDRQFDTIALVSSYQLVLRWTIFSAPLSIDNARLASQALTLALRFTTDLGNLHALSKTASLSYRDL